MTSPHTRKQLIEVQKVRSLHAEKPVRYRLDKELFVFEAGKLIEYELDVPMVEDSNYDWTSPKKEGK